MSIDLSNKTIEDICFNTIKSITLNTAEQEIYNERNQEKLSTLLLMRGIDYLYFI